MGWFGGTLWRGVRSVVETETDSGATLVSEHDADGGDGYQVEAMVCSGTNIAFQSLHNSSSGTKWRCWLSLVSQHLRGVVRAGVDLLLKIWTHALGLHCDYRKWSLGKSKSSDLNLDWHHHCRNQSNMQKTIRHAHTLLSARPNHQQLAIQTSSLSNRPEFTTRSGRPNEFQRFTNAPKVPIASAARIALAIELRMVRTGQVSATPIREFHSFSELLLGNSFIQSACIDHPLSFHHCKVVSSANFELNGTKVYRPATSVVPASNPPRWRFQRGVEALVHQVTSIADVHIGIERIGFGGFIYRLLRLLSCRLCGWRGVVLSACR